MPLTRKLDGALDALIVAGYHPDYLTGHVIDHLGMQDHWQPLDPRRAVSPSQMQLHAHRLAHDAITTAISKAR